MHWTADHRQKFAETAGLCTLTTCTTLLQQPSFGNENFNQHLIDPDNSKNRLRSLSFTTHSFLFVVPSPHTRTRLTTPYDQFNVFLFPTTFATPLQRLYDNHERPSHQLAHSTSQTPPLRPISHQDRCSCRPIRYGREQWKGRSRGCKG